MSGVNEIRSTFLDYFRKHGHEVVASSPLVPRNDPTLMFTNAGMVQFKNVFTGQEKRPYTRAATSQKCVRAGGKHNDLENVGYTARHHTFFEMLGNFSFGDYFKELAIELAWNLLTKDYGLPKDKLLVTVFHTDDEAAAYWKKIAGLSDDRIIRIPTSDNFWAMGDTGPCGPCSEIFFDHGEGIPGGPPGSPDQDGDRFIEIWNLVFMQFEQVTKEERIALPKPSIDTGMGLERLATVLQHKHNNYDIDLFRALIEATAHEINVDPDGAQSASLKVIADGVLPSNEGRGYVLRRIMRRAMRHAHILGAQDPVIFKLVPTLVHEMGDAFPELSRAQPLITETLKLEETRFKKTLGTGLKLLEDETRDLSAGGTLKGEVEREAVGVVELERDLALEGAAGAQALRLVFQQLEASAESLLEARLLELQRLGDQRLRASQFGIGITHLVHQRGHQLVDHRVLRAEDVRMAHRAAHDPAQHVAAAFVGRQHAVGDQERGGAQMISDHLV